MASQIPDAVDKTTFLSEDAIRKPIKRRKRKSPFIEDQALEENDKGATIVVDLEEGESEDDEQVPCEFGDFINDADEEEEENDDSEDEEDDLTSSLYCPIDGMPMSTYKNQETGTISVFCSDKTNCSLPWCRSGEIANMLFQIDTKVLDC